MSRNINVIMRVLNIFIIVRSNDSSKYFYQFGVYYWKIIVNHIYFLIKEIFLDKCSGTISFIAEADYITC